MEFRRSRKPFARYRGPGRAGTARKGFLKLILGSIVAEGKPGLSHGRGPGLTKAWDPGPLRRAPRLGYCGSKAETDMALAATNRLAKAGL